MRAPSTAKRIGRAATLFSLGCAAALVAVPAEAQSSDESAGQPGVANVTFEVIPSADSLRWSYVIENAGQHPVEVVADRRLLSLPASNAPVAMLPPRRGRRGRALRAPRSLCVAPGAPGSNESAHRVTLAPGARYVEGFDVREICGIALPPQIRPGESLTWHYRFARAHGPDAAIVFDDAPTPVTEWTSSTVVAGNPLAWPPLGQTATRGDEHLRVVAHVTSSVGSLDDASAAVTVVSHQRYPLWTMFRPGVVRFEFTSPSGRVIDCRRSFREYTPVREFFVRLTQGASRGETVQLGAACPVDRFAQPGIYRGQAIYETHATGERFGLVTFTGRAGSPFFFVRITGGARAGLYTPLPATDPFAPPAASPSPVVRDDPSASP